MPERWERELRRLRDVEPAEPAVRQRVAGGPREGGLPSRRERVVAGIVAGIVAIAAIALVARTLPGDPAGVGAADLPSLTMSFHDSEVVQEGPDAAYRRVETSIAYGDAVDRSFTSTTPENAIVEWVAAEDLTRFVPGPAVGSQVRFEADGDDPRVLLGRPDDWPNFGRMERIDRLPDEPGEYLLVFVAEYPEGIARTARVVTIVDPGLVQLVARPGDDPGTGTATAYLDGTGVEGSLTRFGSAPAGYPSGSWLAVPAGTRVIMAAAASPSAPWFVAAANASLSKDPATIDQGSTLELDVLNGAVIHGDPGQYALAAEILWMQEHPNETTSERTLALFPIEIVNPAAEASPPPPSPSPSVDGTIAPTPTPSAPASDEILVRIEGLGRSERSRGSPIMRLSFRGETVFGCTQGFTWTTADGTKIDETSGGSSLPPCSYEPLLVVPPRTPIVMRSEEGTEVFPTRTTTPFFTGNDGVGAYVKWPDGNAEFLAIFEVRSEEPVPKRIELGCAADDRIEFVTPDGPRILPGGSAWIRGNMAGFLRTDVIEQMTRDPGGTTEWDGTWQVVRDGSVVAAIDFSSLAGVACRGSGIGGV